MNALHKSFVHPGMMQNRHDLDFMKQNVLAGKVSWEKAFERLKKDASLSFNPITYTHISEGAYGANDNGGEALLKGGNQAYDDALMWYITNDNAYAKKAIQILKAWSYVLWDFDGNNAKLLAGLSGYYFLNAAEILKYSNSGWKQKDILQFKRLMLTVYYPLIRNFFTEANGNWDASMINTMLCIGVFTDNHKIFNRAVERFYRGPGNSGITKIIYPSGQSEEVTRDWGHVQLGLGEFAKAAQVAWTQGVDFYSSADNRLAVGFEYAAKYMLGGDVETIYGAASTVGRGIYKDRDIYEGVYYHYHDMEGLDMPYTAQVINKHTRANTSIGFLTAMRAPGKEVFRKIVVAPLANKLPIQAGAMKVASIGLPTTAVVVKPGQSIQTAIDAGHGNKLWVILSKGVHVLSAPLRLPSNITLSGMGKASILILKSNLRAFTIINADTDMHDVHFAGFLNRGCHRYFSTSGPQ